MKFRIPYNRHRARPLFWLCWFPLLIGRSHVSRQVCFDLEADYDLNPDRVPGALDPHSQTYDAGDPQFDVNKLFGISFTWNPHKESARFGWRWCPVKRHFILSAYCYVNGIRTKEDICEAVSGKKYDCRISLNRKGYLFTVRHASTGVLINQVPVQHSHTRKHGRLLGIYFGGDRTSPKKIIIHLSKIKK